MNVDKMIVRDGGLVQSGTFKTGPGGNLTINAFDSVEVVGSGILPGENIPINSNITVSSEGTGGAGNLEITAGKIKLDNQGQLVSESDANANAGDIILKNLNQSLFLRRGSQISTSAGTQNAPGNGGNISIQSPNGFIFAVPGENSDIKANAFSDRAGSVNINANGIYGIEFREQENSLTNDITASSQFGSDGIVELDIPEIDPESGLLEIAIIPVDNPIAQGCESPGLAQSSLVNAGRGGLPPNPKDVLTPDITQADWVFVQPSDNNRSLSSTINQQPIETNKPIIEATGAVLNEKGQIVLKANPSTIKSRNNLRKNLIPCQN
ncbi:MAG: S-layer family protein [Cyanobacteria bacterium J06649_11]